MEPHGRNPAREGPSADPTAGFEESMRRLGLGGGSGSGASFPYPERPGEEDCAYYMRTGACGFGDRCRYNHPRDRGGMPVGGAFQPVAGVYPERVGQPLCEYYMKTGTCKFGSSCKYHHPREGVGTLQPVSLSYYGYPLRPGERECSYYLRTGQCKFGSTCKFHHPQPIGASVPSAAPVFYPAVQPPSTPSPQQIPQVGGWQIGKSGPYGPMVLSAGVVPVPGWSPYLTPLGQAISPGMQQSVAAVSQSGAGTQLSPPAPTYAVSYSPFSSSVGPSISAQKEHLFSQRPGQPICQFYMRTGDCKFGSTCKYHHPLDWSMPITNCLLSPLGLPLRPGAQICAYYAQHGVCKFGPTCKFDHPMGTLSYSSSASSLLDMPVAPYPIGFSQPTLAPSSSSSELRPNFFSSKDAFSTQTFSSE
ncbi:Zinc finger CCCH domain-containing protein 6 [Apostasia shenzhenica]|uniref:Zinc finger CCCH domain-containing protein 6 n=1 Tax=Apostasia shenzhenica TaxID=1088818 RepID=A0A2I0AQ42_9ASPA|nr:Zinc finger CCCH domain-containing protein 6 [Apostasia shenzhenica]